MTYKPEDINKYWADSAAAFEPARKFHTWMAETFASMTHAQLQAANDFIDLNTERVKALYDAKDLPEVMAEQQKIAKAYGEKIVEHAEKAQTLLSQAQDEFQELSTTVIDGATPAPRSAKAKRKAA